MAVPLSSLRIIFLAASCLVTNAISPAAQLASAETTADKINIGAIYPLTGSLAFVGTEIRDGIILAKEEAGESCGGVNVIFEDNGYRLKDTVTQAQKLLTRSKVKLLLTLWDGADVVAPLTEKAGVPHISIRWNPDVAARNNHTFTFESTYKSFAADQLAMMKKLGVKKFSIMQVEAQGNMLEANELARLAAQEGIEVLDHVTFESGLGDYRSLISRATRKNPDMVVLATWPPETELIIKQLKELLPHQKHTGYYEVVEDLATIEGSPFVSQLGFMPEFDSKFFSRFGYRFKARAAHSYELMKYLCELFSRLPGKLADSKETISEIMKLSNRKTVIGNISINQSRNIEHPNYVKVVKNGVLVPYE